MSILNSEPPQAAAQVAGHIAFTLVYASPYLLALMASRARDPGVRGGLLAALGLLSLVASFSSLSLVTVVLLPATFVLWFAAGRSLAASDRPLLTSVPAAAVGLLMAATVGFGFFALFGIQDPEARCWVLYQGADGQPRWEFDEPVSFASRGHCTSDIITYTEAGMGMAAVGAALLAMLLVSHLRWPPGGHRVRTGLPSSDPAPPG